MHYLCIIRASNVYRKKPLSPASSECGKSHSPFLLRAARLRVMNQTELIIAVGGALFLAFLLGWLSGWLALRAGDPGRPPVSEPLTLGDADRLAAAERDVAVARGELRAAQTEIEELRSYIDRKLDRRPDEPPASAGPGA